MLSNIKAKYCLEFVVLALFTFLLMHFIGQWKESGTPPLQTLGDTRLVYALSLLITGMVLHYFLKSSLPLLLSLLLAVIFILVNLLHPEQKDRNLMPALQSPWFIPHVLSYIQGYALLGLGTILSFFSEKKMVILSEKVLSIGIIFITFGLFSGAYWAKEAWGTYWSWDPKETWGLMTWFCYMAYLHWVTPHKQRPLKARSLILGLNILILLTCWFGLKYIPTARQSLHIYSN